MSRDSREPWEGMLEDCCGKQEQQIANAHVQSFKTLLRGIDTVMSSLAEEITMEIDRTCAA